MLLPFSVLLHTFGIRTLLFVSAVGFESTFIKVKVVFHHTLPIRE